MNRSEAQHFLCSNGWLSKLPNGFQKDWLNGARLAQLGTGEHLFTIEDDPRFMVGLAQGSFGALLGYGAQEMRLQMIYGAGTWFGDAAVVSGHAHRGIAIARSPCTCLIVPNGHVEQIAARYPEVWRWLAQNVLVQVDAFMTMKEAAFHRDPVEQLLYLMISLRKLNPLQADYELSTAEIGKMVGLSRNTVAKSLRALEYCNLVERKYARLHIPGITELQNALAKRSAAI